MCICYCVGSQQFALPSGNWGTWVELVIVTAVQLTKALFSVDHYKTELRAPALLGADQIQARRVLKTVCS